MSRKNPLSVSGIYQITNIENGKKYIGYSVNIRKRKINHLDKLRKGIHANRFLQEDFNFFGETSFDFKILVESNDYSMESLFIEKHNTTDSRNGYNIFKILPELLWEIQAIMFIKKQVDEDLFKTKVEIILTTNYR